MDYVLKVHVLLASNHVAAVHTFCWGDSLKIDLKSTKKEILGVFWLKKKKKTKLHILWYVKYVYIQKLHNYTLKVVFIWLGCEILSWKRNNQKIIRVQFMHLLIIQISNKILQFVVKCKL